MTITQADGLADTLDGLNTTSFLYGHNGSTWDRITSTSRALDVNVKSGGGHADGAAFTADSTAFTPDGGVYEASPTTCADNKVCIGGMSTDRRPLVDADLHLAGTNADTDVGTGTSATQRVAVARDSELCNIIDTLSAVVAETTSGSNEVISPTAGQTVYICDIVLVGTPATPFKIVSGAGADCVTTPVDKTGAMDFAANGGFAHYFGGRLKSDEADGICTDAGGSNEINGVITYVKVATVS